MPKINLDFLAFLEAQKFLTHFCFFPFIFVVALQSSEISTQKSDVFLYSRWDKNKRIFSKKIDKLFSMQKKNLDFLALKRSGVQNRSVWGGDAFCIKTSTVSPNDIIFFSSETWAQSGSDGRNFYRHHLRKFYRITFKIRDFGHIWGVFPEFST